MEKSGDFFFFITPSENTLGKPHQTGELLSDSFGQQTRPNYCRKGLFVPDFKKLCEICGRF